MAHFNPWSPVDFTLGPPVPARRSFDWCPIAFPCVFHLPSRAQTLLQPWAQSQRCVISLTDGMDGAILVSSCKAFFPGPESFLWFLSASRPIFQHLPREAATVLPCWCCPIRPSPCPTGGCSLLPPSPQQLLLAARRGPVTALRFTNTSSLSPPPLLHLLHIKEKKKKKSFAFQALPLVQPMSSFPRLQHAFGLLQSLRDCSHPWGIAPVVRAKLHKLKDVMGLC